MLWPPDGFSARTAVAVGEMLRLTSTATLLRMGDNGPEEVQLADKLKDRKPLDRSNGLTNDYLKT